jgi:serine phosphatase RsbU (regulator of sigma subunit)
VIARAGHPLPLLRDPSGRVRVLDCPGGPLLGVDRDAAYPAAAVALEPGSVLALYTDGLIERPGVDIDDSLGELARRFAEAPDRSLEHLADTLTGPAGAAGRRGDDTALLLLRATR